MRSPYRLILNVKLEVVSYSAMEFPSGRMVIISRAKWECLLNDFAKKVTSGCPFVIKFCDPYAVSAKSPPGILLFMA